MTDVWIAPGHGRRPDGTLDPGASAGSKTEQSEGDLIVGHAAARLRNHYGLKVYRQPRGGPNFPGSIDHINSLRPTVAVEVHHDWIGAPRGAFGHWHSSSTPAMRLANAMYSRIFRARLPVRPSWHRARNELAIVRRTVRPTVLWECDRIGSVTNHRQYGHLLADGIADYLGATPPPPPPPEPDPEVEVKLFRIGNNDTVYVTDGSSRRHVHSRAVMSAMGWKMSQVESLPADHVLAQLPELTPLVLLGRTPSDPTVWEFRGNPLRRRKIASRSDGNRELRDADFLRIPADHWLWRTPEE